jgi:hypothetical protein
MSTPQEPSSSSHTLLGKCLCGAVQFTVEDSFAYALNCHCSQCRRATGSAFKPFAGIEREKFRLSSGSQSLLVFGEALTHDARCSKCGSLLYSLVRDGTFVHIPLGALCDEPSIRPSAHIFVGSKASWFAITDSLPQHHEFG